MGEAVISRRVCTWRTREWMRLTNAPDPAAGSTPPDLHERPPQPEQTSASGGGFQREACASQLAAVAVANAPTGCVTEARYHSIGPSAAR
jgi:hypothetical protein